MKNKILIVILISPLILTRLINVGKAGLCDYYVPEEQTPIQYEIKYYSVSPEAQAKLLVEAYQRWKSKKITINI